MFSIQQFFGKDPKFFDLLEASAKEALKCAEALVKLLREPNSSADPRMVQSARQRCKEITEEISELAVKSFITILDREDIEALADAIYKIPKPMEKFAERFMISREVLGAGLPFRQVDLIQTACETVLGMVLTLRSGMRPDLLMKLNAKLQSVEGEADALEVDLLRDLYKSDQAMKVIVVRDLYDLLEKVIDRCRDTGNVVVHICHKNT